MRSGSVFLPRYCSPQRGESFQKCIQIIHLRLYDIINDAGVGVEPVFTVLIAMDLMPYSSWNERARAIRGDISSRDYRDKFQFFCFHVRCSSFILIYCYLVLTTLNHTIFLLDLQWNMAVWASGVLQKNEFCKNRRIRSKGLCLLLKTIPALITLL